MEAISREEKSPGDDEWIVEDLDSDSLEGRGDERPHPNHAMLAMGLHLVRDQGAVEQSSRLAETSFLRRTYRDWRNLFKIGKAKKPPLWRVFSRRRKEKKSLHEESRHVPEPIKTHRRIAGR